MDRLTKSFGIGCISLASILFGCSKETSIDAEIISRRMIFERGAPFFFEEKGYDVILNRKSHGKTMDTIYLNFSDDWSKDLDWVSVPTSDPPHSNYIYNLTIPGNAVKITIPDSNLNKTNYEINVNKETVYDILKPLD